VIISLLLPDSGLTIQSVNPQEKVLECRIHSQTTLAPCPACKQEQAAVYSHYQRKVADLPWSDLSVRLLIVVRRIFCRNDDCSRKTFAERPSFVLPYARRTTRLNQNLSKPAFATNARTGSKLSAVLAMSVSSSTMLRLMHGHPTEPASGPVVLGVDDFATCKGKSYGTILVDIEKQQVMDLLPSREAGPLTNWLQSRPSICFSPVTGLLPMQKQQPMGLRKQFK
jgi:transposase